MKDLVVLYTGDIVYLSSISEDEIFDLSNNDLLFFSNGRVRRFKKNGIAYMAIFDEENNNKFDSYRSEINFWNNNKINKNRTDTAANYTALGDRFNILDIIPINVDSKANVILAHEEIYPQSLNTQGIKTETLYRSIPFGIASPLKETIDLYFIPSLSEYDFVDTTAKSVYPLLTPYYNFIKNKKYLGANGQLRDLTDSETSILTDVIQVFDFIFTQSGFLSHLTTLKLNEPFNKTIDLINRYNHNYGTIDIKYHTLYNDEYFARLRLGLIEFKYWLIQYKDDYTKINSNDLVVYIVNLFDPVELSYLSYETKTNLLDKILIDNFWVIGNWGFNKLNEEEAILKIIRCIAKEDLDGTLNYSEIDKFMDFLNVIYDFSKKQTLYEVLYDRINDSAFLNDDGKGNKGQLVKIVYNLWSESKFNPQHSVSSIAQNALGLFQYTPYNSRWQSDDPTIIFPILDENAAPMLINYESEKTLLWYIDNFNFEFYKNKIVAKENIKDYGYQPYGVYNIFQPIALKVTDANDTIIRMPVKGIVEGGNIEDFINNCIPVFYLQYVDDLGDYSDTKETIGIAIDIVLTFSGVGNIAKLRHVKDLSLLRKFFVAGELSLAESASLTRALSGLASGFEAIMGIASLVHSFATASCTIYYNNQQSPPEPNDPEYQKYKLCQNIDLWLFALEMISLSGDLLAKRAFKRATRKLQQSIPSGSEYNELRTAVNSLDELDNLLVYFLQSLQTTHPTVFSRVNNFTTQEKKFTFMFDFEGRPSALSELETNPYLLDDAWDDILHLTTYRNNLEFLESYYFINKDVRCAKLRDHLLTGHYNSTGTSVSGWHHIEGNSSENAYGRIDNIIDDSDPRGYFSANVSIKNQFGFFISKTANGGLNDMFPRHWTKEELLENISLAFINKTYHGPPNQYIGTLNDGKQLIICINGNAGLIDATTSIKTVWPKR